MIENPDGSAPIENAILWLEGTLLGTLATTMAVIAVALVGLGMLNGRIDWRRGATVVMGCFILFGARSIAQGVRGLAVTSPPTEYTRVVYAPAPVERPRPQPVSTVRPEVEL